MNEVLLLIEKCSHCFSYYDIESGERLFSIPLLNFPHEFVVDSLGKFAYIGHYGIETSGHLGSGGTSIFQIDLEAKKLVRTIDLSPFNRIHGLQIDNQDRLYALSEEKAILLTLNNPQTANSPDHAVFTGGIKSHLFALTRNGEFAFSMNLLSHTITKIKPYDASFNPIVCCPGRKPEGYALSKDEKILFVTCRISNTLVAINTETMKVLYSAPSRNDATRIYLCRDGNLLVTNYGDSSISLVDSKTLTELEYFPMEAKAIALSLHPTKNLAFVSLDNNKLAYLNLNNLSFDRFIQTQKEPDVSYLWLSK